MQLFSADPVVFSKMNFFFDPEKVKKWASKVAHNRPKPFYFTVQPRPQPTAQNGKEEIIFFFFSFFFDLKILFFY